MLLRIKWFWFFTMRVFQVREAVLGRGDSGSLVADIVLPAAREVARMERVRSDLAPILQNGSISDLIWLRSIKTDPSQVRRIWSERDFSGEVEARLRAWVARYKEELPVYAIC